MSLEDGQIPPVKCTGPSMILCKSVSVTLWQENLDSEYNTITTSYKCKNSFTHGVVLYTYNTYNNRMVVHCNLMIMCLYFKSVIYLLECTGCHDVQIPIAQSPEATYTLRSVTMGGHAKYRRNSLACKMQEDSACNTGDWACNFIFLYL